MTKIWMGVMAFGMILGGVLLSSTARFGPPPRFVKTKTPDWVKTVQVEPPHRHQEVCVVRSADGQIFNVHGQTGKTPYILPIGGHLYAERVSQRSCSVMNNKTGIICSWRTNAADRKFFAGCKRPNPDYETHDLQKRRKFTDL